MIGRIHSGKRSLLAFSSFIVVLLAACILAAAFIGPAGSNAEEAATGKTFAPLEKATSSTSANLALIVEFSDTPETSYYTQPYQYNSEIPTNFAYLYDSINKLAATKTEKSYRDYFLNVSKGQFDVWTFFPQAYDDGSYFRIRLDMKSTEYSGETDDQEIISTALDKLAAARPDIDASVFDIDKNEDPYNEYIDNVLLIMDIPSTTEITSHQYSLAEPVTVGSGSKARKASLYTVVYGGGNASLTFDRFSESVAAHERLHTLGARDLYRMGSGDTGPSPIGLWDMMSKGGVYSWPLAKTREDVGWTSIKEADMSNSQSTYTLYSPKDSDDSSGKMQALKIKTSLSESEYFVVEYRERMRASSAMGPTVIYPYDAYVPSDGLIVYRVNESFADEGNIRGNDYMYIFRPGETGLKDSGGNINLAALAYGSYTTCDYGTLRTSLGSEEPAAGITDGAIVYSNGMNSGLVITATAQTDDSITFKIEQKQSSDSSAWMPVLNADGSLPLANFNANAMKIVNDADTPYVLAYRMIGTGWAVAKHDSTDWVNLGSASTDIGNADIAIFNGTPYVAGTTSNGSKAYLKKWNGSSWENIASVDSAMSSDPPNLAVIGGKLYMLVYQNDGLHLHVLNGSALQQYGSTIPQTSVMSQMIIEVNGEPAVATSIIADTWRTSLFVSNGSLWMEKQLSTSASSVIDAVALNNKTYVYTYSSDGGVQSPAHLITLGTSGAVEKDAVLDELKGASNGASMTTDGTSLYISAPSASNGIRTYKVDTSASSIANQVGGVAYTSNMDVDSCASANNIYLAILDSNSNTVQVRKHATERPSTDPDPDPEPDPGTDPQPDPTPVQKAITSVSLSPTSFTYDGKTKKPAVTVMCGSTKLKLGTDYTVSYPVDARNVGTYTVTVAGIGNYKGKLSAKFKIVQAPSSGGQEGSGQGGSTTKPTTPSTPGGTTTKPTTPTNPGGTTTKPTTPTDPGSSSGQTTKPMTPATGTQVMHRMYNPYSGEHLYTASINERDSLVKIGWKYEGEGWKAPVSSKSPVYRLYNPNSSDHHYTLSSNERDTLVKLGWRYEGVGWYSDDAKGVPLYRQFNPYATIGTHNYTTSKHENDSLAKIGWHAEGIAWYGVK